MNINTSYTFSNIYMEIDKIKDLINQSFKNIFILFITKEHQDLKIIINRSLSDQEELILYENLLSINSTLPVNAKDL